MGIKIAGTGLINGHRTLGTCPQCSDSTILPNMGGCYSVPNMFPNETARCVSCGYVEFESGEGVPEAPVHGGCRMGCRMKHRVSLPVLRDRADGVKGHFCVGRFVDGIYIQLWSIKSQRWSSTADYDPLTEAAAIKIRDELIAAIQEKSKHVC